MFCTDIPDPVYFLFSEFTPQILYYSHIPTAAAALMLGIFVFSRSRSPASLLLLIIAGLFTAWSLSDLVLWTQSDSRAIMFVWSYLNLLQNLISVSVLFFAYAYIEQKRIPYSLKVVTSLLLLPIILLLPSEINLTGFNQFICEAEEGVLINYFRFVDVFFFFCTAIYLLYKCVTSNDKFRVFAFSASVLAFLLFYIGANIFSSYTGLWEIQQYGLFGLPIFLAGLVYLILQYKAFNIRATGSIGLVVIMWVLVFSLLFIHSIETVRTIVLLTLLVIIIIGYIFILMTRREIKQREEIEKLAKDLKRANERLKKLDQLKSEFVSIASHQLRSPLTSIRGYASMLLEGSYGKFGKKAQEAISRIHASSRYMALTVEDFLNVSRIESGTMKYELSDFDICEMVQTVCEDIKPSVLEKKLEFTFSSNIKGVCTVHADIGKVRQIIQNLVDNAAKYTPEGRIAVTLNQLKKTNSVEITITDTGIGMSADTLRDLFHKFTRAKNANNVNVIGSGLGLYVAKQMAEKMGGTITASSPGEGKGSTFVITLPLSGTKKKSSK